MTIASHCIDLLRTHGPMTREELGESCRVDGVTAARDPAVAAQGALQYDRRVVRADGRYHLVERLLEGRWLTLERPDDPQSFDPDIDLQCLSGLVHREGVPLASGGCLAGSTYYGGGWTGPVGWVPSGEVIGLRLLDGVAHVSSVVVDDDVRHRGERLAARLKERFPPRSFDIHRRHDVAAILLRLLVEDDDVLREPVPPLRRLFPAPEPATHLPADPFRTTLRVRLSPQVYASLVDAAAEAGVPLDAWVAGELDRLHAWPRRPWLDEDPRLTGAEPWPDEDAPDRRAFSVVRLDRLPR